MPRRDYLRSMPMSNALRVCALGLWASLVCAGCDDDPERPYTSLDPSKADPVSLDGALPRPSGAGAASEGPAPTAPALDAGLGERAPPPPDAGRDAGLRIPGPGDFLSFDAAIALQTT